MNLGELRLRFMRVAQYYTFILMIVNVLTALAVGAIPIWAAILLAVSTVPLYWLDGKYGVRGEVSYLNQNNQWFKDLLADIQKIKNKLGVE